MTVDQMEHAFRLVASYFAVCVEAAAVLTIAIGAAEAVFGVIRNLRWTEGQFAAGRAIWVRFASWILLSLEFTLGADIIRSAIAPTWDEIGKLAAIAAIRTALNFFLVRDVEQTERLRMSEAQTTAPS